MNSPESAAARRRGPAWLRAKIPPWFWGALLLAAAMQQVHFRQGRIFEKAGAFHESDTLFGWDVPRAIADMTEPGHNARNNVHPLFTLAAKPPGLLLRRGLGLDAATAALLVVSSMGAVNALLFLALLRTWRVRWPESLACSAIFAFGTTPLLTSSIPETGSFVLASMLTSLLLASLALARGFRSRPLWIAAGVFAYGMAVPNAIKNFVAYGCAKPPDLAPGKALRRLAVHAALVALIAAGLTRAAGGSFDWMAEAWVFTPEARGGHIPGLGRMLTENYLLHAVVSPQPRAATIDFYHLRNKRVVTMSGARYGPAGRVLAAAWSILAGWGIWAACRHPRPGERPFLAVLLFCAAWDFVFFSQYHVPFEGVFLQSPHSAGPVLAALVFPAVRCGEWSGARRRTALAAGWILALGLAANNLAALREAARLAAGG